MLINAALLGPGLYTSVQCPTSASVLHHFLSAAPSCTFSIVWHVIFPDVSLTVFFIIFQKEDGVTKDDDDDFQETLRHIWM